MKKGQSGVSLIALVITIIVVIILAAIAFGTSTRTITNANWSTFQNAVGEVRTALQERVTTVKGEEAAKGTTRTDAQVYNFVAKGGDIVRNDGSDNKGSNTVSGDISGDNNAAWLSREYANNLTATRIEPAVIENVLGLKNRNIIKVNTPNASGREVSFFVTNKGDVFIWPPYEYEGKLYVVTDQNKPITGSSASDATLPAGPIDVNGVSVYISTSASSALSNNTTAASSSNCSATTPVVYYSDTSSAAQPQGLETNHLFNDGSNTVTPVTP